MLNRQLLLAVFFMLCTAARTLAREFTAKKAARCVPPFI
jgi:hypothetical protein